MKEGKAGPGVVPGPAVRLALVPAVLAGILGLNLLARVSGLFDLPGAWLWGSAVVTIPVVLPVWLLLPTPWARFGIGRLLPLLVATSVILLPFVAVSAFGEYSPGSPGRRWFAVAVALFAVSVAEELLFRCFLLDLLHGRGSGAVPVLVSSALFAVVHLDNPHHDPVGIANIFLFGGVLGMLRIRGVGLAGLAMLHWLWNFFTGMIAGWNVSGIELPSLLRPVRPPFGVFGPESSLILTAALTASAAALALIDRAGRPGKGAAPEPIRKVEA